MSWRQLETLKQFAHSMLRLIKLYSLIGSVKVSLIVKRKMTNES